MGLIPCTVIYVIPFDGPLEGRWEGKKEGGRVGGREPGTQQYREYRLGMGVPSGARTCNPGRLNATLFKLSSIDWIRGGSGDFRLAYNILDIPPAPLAAQWSHKDDLHHMINSLDELMPCLPVQ